MADRAKRITRPLARTARAPRRALGVRAALLAVSGLLRLGEGAGRAFAGAADEPAAAAAPDPACGTPGALELLASLRAREEKLAAREAEASRREAAIVEARTEAQALLAELTARQQDLARTLTIADEAAEGDVARLVAVYENMKPKEAAPLFEVMDPGFAAGFLARMRPEASAAVLAGLDPQKAYAISAELAGRNAAAPGN